jgi:hypothetical protein
MEQAFSDILKQRNQDVRGRIAVGFTRSRMVSSQLWTVSGGIAVRPAFW